MIKRAYMFLLHRSACHLILLDSYSIDECTYFYFCCNELNCVPKYSQVVALTSNMPIFEEKYL